MKRNPYSAEKAVKIRDIAFALQADLLQKAELDRSKLYANLGTLIGCADAVLADASGLSEHKGKK